MSAMQRASDQIEAERQLREHFWNRPPKVDVDRHKRNEEHEQEEDDELVDFPQTPVYLQSASNHAQVSLTRTMVEQDYLGGQRKFSDEDFRYSRTFSKVMRHKTKNEDCIQEEEKEEEDDLI